MEMMETNVNDLRNIECNKYYLDVLGNKIKIKPDQIKEEYIS